MAVEYMHIGIPVTHKKPGMIFNEWGQFWVNKSVDEYEYKIEYLKFEDGTRFPDILNKQPHVAYKVDDVNAYAAKADRIIFGPEQIPGCEDKLAFVIIDDSIIELYEAH